MKTPLFAPLLLIGLVACGGAQSQPSLVPQVQTGPGLGQNAGRVLALSANCGSIDFECPEAYISLVDNIVRSSMDFSGYALVDPETLRNETRERDETISKEVVTNESASTGTHEDKLGFDETTSFESGSRMTRTSSIVHLTGSGFNDLSVTDRKQVLSDAGADSILTVRIVVGAQVGVWTPNQNVEVMVKLGVAGGDQMAWAARCLASSNDFSSVEAALENAARCAVYGGTGN